ncbi:3-dehydroquinate synthase II [Patescibacteria group bacterium]|nr:3-dehydroquinate synthase II [Patescibacteria group bacterium]MBU4481577.1 3-dehydroquinate synthase II [Patescibacteria group bacterium]
MKSLWLKLNGKWEDIKPLSKASLEAGVDVLVVEKENVSRVKELARGIKVASESGGDIRIVKVNNKEDLKALKEDNCALVEIDSGEKEDLAVAAGGIADWLMIKTKDWKIIPLENLIAKLSGKKLLTFASNLEEATLALGILEKGVDGIVFSPKNPAEIKAVKKILMETSKVQINLMPARLTKIKPIGLGDRVCVDTVSILNLGEGMLVGSQANALFLIHSETLENPYVETRPFRVNAGAVHAYIKVSKDKTKYLSELKSGDEVLIANQKGEARQENVGRIKIERRPMLLLEAESGGETKFLFRPEIKKISTILQNAETICLVDKEGKPISVSKLKVGDEVLVHKEQGGRHFGIKVEESLKER